MAKSTTPPVEHRFKPGQSGNPGGRAKDALVSALARELTAEAINSLAEIMRSKKAASAARVSAAVALLDRGYGRPAQQLNVDANIRPADVSADPLTPSEWQATYGELGSSRPS